MRKIAAIFACICCIISFVGCGDKYNEEDFIGKTSLVIVEEYGAFNCAIAALGEDGLYRNGRCGYIIDDAQKGFLGTSQEVLFFIRFDENGVAVECSEGYRPGG